MSNKTIWNALRAGGLTAAGAAAMMGNMAAESALKSNNVQDGMGYTDEEYTSAVDSGRITREQFATDQRGYGLTQTTYHSRKRALYDFAKNYGTSIGDESMQVAFVLYEFPQEAPDTFALCCTSDDIKKCTEWICKYYERPYFNNIDDRYKFAMGFFNEFVNEPVSDNGGCESCQIPSIPSASENVETCTLTVKVLKKGSKGRDVRMAQIGLIDMGYLLGKDDGDFGNQTLEAVNRFKEKCNLNPDGILDQAAWQVLFQ